MDWIIFAQILTKIHQMSFKHMNTTLEVIDKGILTPYDKGTIKQDESLASISASPHPPGILAESAFKTTNSK